MVNWFLMVVVAVVVVVEVSLHCRRWKRRTRCCILHLVGVVVAGPTVTLIRVWGVLISKEAKMGFLEITHTHSLRECETFQSQRNGILVWFLFIFFNFQFVERERFGRFWVE